MTASPQIDYRIDWTGTYAALVAGEASGIPVGCRAVTTDLGSVRWNGVTWVTGSPHPLMIGGIPLVIMPTCSSVSATGTATVGTTLPLTAGQGFFYLPANFLATVSAAGWYYGTISTGTSVVLFNNTYSGIGQPAVPAATTAFAGLSGGTPTGSTGAQTVTCVIPAGAMSTNGSFEFKYIASYNSSGSNKTVSSAFGALNLFTSTATTTTSQAVTGSVRNSGTAAIQAATLLGSEYYATATQVLGRGTVNTAAAVNYVVTLNNAAATDFIILESYNFSIATI